jgi:pseudouridine-5'-phosphate glycosidase
VDRLPFFLASETSIALEHRVDSPAEAARIAATARELDTPSTVLLCNPVPAGDAMDAAEVASAVAIAEQTVARAGVDGRARTPALLAALADATGGRSLEANLALLDANARLAGEVAAWLAREERDG